MARRENQSLVIALIIMVMLVVCLCISTYYFWNSAQKKEKEVATAKGASNSAAETRNKAVDASIQMKQFLGYDSEATIDSIKTAYDKDMQLFGNGVDETERNYRKLPQHLMTVIQDRNKQVAELNDTRVKLSEEKEGVRKEGLEQVKVARTGQESANTDLAKQRTSFKSDIASQVAVVQKAEANYNRTVARLSEENRKATAALALATDDYEKLRSKHTQLEDKLRKLQNVSFERPDGKVTYVNQRSRAVYVNKGRAHGLQRQATFSVYDVGENDMARLEPKGKIEITKIMGENLAEGRILEDSVTNPILTGDVIYSPVWESGRAIHFALAGLLDTNGDGKSDSELVRNLISINGGVVDAEVTDKGIRTGEIGIETRYLVIGKRPTDKSDAQGLREFSRIQSDADSYGISVISLERFLTDMGYQAVGKTVRLGDSARVSDLDSSAAEDKGTGRFRPRKPPSVKVGR